MTKTDFDTKYSPIIMPEPFAESGNKTLPADTQDDASGFSFPLGFSGAYSSPHSNNGKYVTRKQMNAIGNLATHNDFYHRCGGLNTFDPAFAAVIGGYPKGAILQYLYGTNLYFIRSLVDNNMADPSNVGVDGINWAYCYQSQPLDEIDDTFVAHVSTTSVPSITNCTLVYSTICRRGGIVTIRNLNFSITNEAVIPSYANAFLGKGILVSASNSPDVITPTYSTPNKYTSWKLATSFGYNAVKFSGASISEQTPTYTVQTCDRGDYLFVAIQNGIDSHPASSGFNLDTIDVSFDIYIV